MQLVTRVVARQPEFENKDVAYVVITRFNVYRPEVASRDLRIPAGTPEWCAHRAEAFQAFCLPPILKQRLMPHAWFILFDAEFNEPVRRLVDALRAYPWIIPLFIDREAAGSNLVGTISPMIRERLGELGTRYVCGVRLDSDDSLHLRFFAALDKAISAQRHEWRADGRYCVNFPYGVLREGEKLVVYLSEKQYFGLVEPLATMKTPYQRKHREIDKVAQVIDVFTESPMWLYHRHATNVGKINVDHFERVANPRRIVQHFGYESLPDAWIPTRESAVAGVAEEVSLGGASETA